VGLLRKAVWRTSGDGKGAHGDEASAEPPVAGDQRRLRGDLLLASLPSRPPSGGPSCVVLATIIKFTSIILLLSLGSL